MRRSSRQGVLSVTMLPGAFEVVHGNAHRNNVICRRKYVTLTVYTHYRSVVLHHTCSGAHGGHARFSGRAPHAGCHAARARLINVKRSGRCGQCARPGRAVVAPRAPARNRTPQARGGARRTPIRVCGCAVLFGLFAFVVVANAFFGVSLIKNPAGIH